MDFRPPALTRSRAATGKPRGPARPGFRVVIVDSDPFSQLGLESVVSAMPDAVGVATAGTTGLRQALARTGADAILLRSGSDFDGRLSRNLLSQLPGTGVVVVVDAVHRQRWYLEVLRAAGVRGLVSGDSPPSSLREGLERIQQGGEYVDPRLVPILRRPGRRAGGRLTPRQREVLVLLAEGCTNPEIAEALVISTETVRTHIRHILYRLDAHDRVHAVTQAFRFRILDVESAGLRMSGSTGRRNPIGGV
ncbi:response regulator transcription factor [Amycolatopsis sp. NPDC004625]|uniref:helix-turn-helix transcriptional regulator n=1 Tax=Amycolatopsis sp. NPDC004625 TaxID=3154670 RepID=UPI0033B179FD